MQQKMTQFCLFLQLAAPGLFLFWFQYLKEEFYREIEDLSGIRTQIVGEEGKHAYQGHLFVMLT